MSNYLFTPERLAGLRAVLRYDPGAGQFIRVDGKSRQRKLKNPAATAKTYKQINVSGVIYYAHILAYWFMTGEPVPEGYELDHRDRNKQNFRWDNLVLVTSSLNKLNRGRRKDCPHGVPGVKAEAYGALPWSAQIRVDHSTYHLGRFATREEAIRARLAGEEKYIGRVVSDFALAELDGMS